MLRFGIGLVGLFTTTVVASLALVVLALAALPGLRPTVIRSGSMSPAIERGDVVLYRSPPGDIDVRTVIVFDDPHLGSTVHRVADVHDDASLTTKGDANRDVDPAAVHRDEVVGTGVVLVPWIGLPRVWVSTGDYPAIVGSLLAVVGALIVGRWATDPATDPWASDDHVGPLASWLGTAPPKTATTLLAPVEKEELLVEAAP